SPAELGFITIVGACRRSAAVNACPRSPAGRGRRPQRAEVLLRRLAAKPPRGTLSRISTFTRVCDALWGEAKVAMMPIYAHIHDLVGVQRHTNARTGSVRR